MRKLSTLGFFVAAAILVTSISFASSVSSESCIPYGPKFATLSDSESKHKLALESDKTGVMTAMHIPAQNFGNQGYSHSQVHTYSAMNMPAQNFGNNGRSMDHVHTTFNA